jgi:hypothetical protein
MLKQTAFINIAAVGKKFFLNARRQTLQFATAPAALVALGDLFRLELTSWHE